MSNKKGWIATTINSNALDLEPGLFTWNDPVAIAKSLKQSADSSTRRKSSSYKSAMSMLSFYINRSGSNLSSKRKKILERAKRELRKLYT